MKGIFTLKSDKVLPESQIKTFLAGGGALIGVILIVFGILRYVLHVL